MWALGQWLIGLTAAAILCTLANSLMPEGVVRQVGRLAGGLVILASLLRPMVHLEANGLASWLEEHWTEYDVHQEELERERDKSMKLIIEQSCQAYIVDKAAQLGVSCTAEVSCIQDEDGGYLPWEVTLHGTLTPEQQTGLTQQIQEELLIPAVRQSYQTKEELP